jgi:diaminopimelate decarboxylase
LDIGGGLPHAYGFDDAKISKSYNFKEYSKRLRKEVPELWSGNFKIITEFGRSIMSRHGFTASKAQAVKPLLNENGKSCTVLTHVGANLFTRTAYQP